MTVPTKRRQLHQASDKVLAEWATNESFTEQERSRAQAERDRRKAQRKVEKRTVQVLVSSAGATPDQVASLTDVLTKEKPTTILHPFTTPAIHRACLNTGAEVIVTDQFHGDADVVIGCVPMRKMPERKQSHPVWASLRHAKDRGRDVQVIWPTGDLLTGRW